MVIFASLYNKYSSTLCVALAPYLSIFYNSSHDLMHVTEPSFKVLSSLAVGAALALL